MNEFAGQHAALAFHSLENLGGRISANDVCLIGRESESDGTADASRGSGDDGESVSEAPEYVVMLASGSAEACWLFLDPGHFFFPGLECSREIPVIGVDLVPRFVLQAR